MLNLKMLIFFIPTNLDQVWVNFRGKNGSSFDIDLLFLFVYLFVALLVVSLFIASLIAHAVFV